MGVKIVSGNIFTSNCQTLVNTVNCVGVMGAGIALEYRLRYPEMYNRYVKLCNSSRIKIGMLWLYKSKDRWILCFPTKKHWKYPSRAEYLHAGLQKFISTYESKSIESIAFPLLGADKGGISQEESLRIMRSYLDNISIGVEIFRYDQKAKDDIYDAMKNWLSSHDVEHVSNMTGLRRDYVVRIMDAIQSPDIVQINQLAHVRGIGIRTLEKVFQVAMQSVMLETRQTGEKKPPTS